MGEIRYIIIAKQCEVAGTSSILDGCLKKLFSSVYDLGKRFFGHPSRIDDVSCNLTQFCYSESPGSMVAFEYPFLISKFWVRLHV